MSVSSYKLNTLDLFSLSTTVPIIIPNPAFFVRNKQGQRQPRDDPVEQSNHLTRPAFPSSPRQPDTSMSHAMTSTSLTIGATYIYTYILSCLSSTRIHQH